MVLGAMVVASFTLWREVSAVLPGIGADEQGEDPWTDPIGVEKVGPFQVAHIPDCAAAPVVRIELWDEDSDPYWVVSGPPTPMETFAVGGLPEGFVEDVPFEEPPPGATLRLVVVRSVKGVAGVRYQSADLRTGYAAAGEPISRYQLEDFKTGSVCGGEDETDGDGSGADATTSDDGDEGGTGG
jgi:hypothetical protein